MEKYQAPTPANPWTYESSHLPWKPSRPETVSDLIQHSRNKLHLSPPKPEQGKAGNPVKGRPPRGECQARYHVEPTEPTLLLTLHLSQIGGTTTEGPLHDENNISAIKTAPSTAIAERIPTSSTAKNND